jgi:hypothetical protein
MVAGELPDDPPLLAVLPGQLERPRPEFLRTRQIQRGGQSRLLAQLVGRQDLGIGTISVLSASRSLSAIAQLLVPRSMPRLKRAVMELGVLMI